ncbi:TRP-domain-containing protein [Byssothecium circinans]|uniref:TRP-domain-containing protein n=1 Tax=Byssothecium circinans TaxID=147558 RepID=A0A6A5UCX3_9PLEO|nr:TRP-domain-containing protein [Byssothecium circinans]
MAFSALQSSIWVIVLIVLSLVGLAAAENDYVTGIIGGKEYLVRDDRRPSLYTQDYGSCMSGSNITVNRFNAAYYKDNMTVLFHLDGETSLKNETIMMNIGVYAYGENRFDLTFNPACPIRAGIPIEASGIIPISEKDVSGIPPLALEIPDFEGQAILRIFSNSSESEIGCFTAVLTNGNSFSQPIWVSSILGLFTFVALISSFAAAIYGDNVAEIRKHYAHSVSLLVVFTVWQHIYFSGAISVNWPSVLVAFWNNYAWAGGMIYSATMQSTISSLIGSNKGDTTTLGAAGTGMRSPDLGGGFNIRNIYQRTVFPTPLNIPGLIRRNKYNLVARRLEASLADRELVDMSRGFDWYGHSVDAGVPLPGNYSGFPGTLAQTRIPASNAFMTGFLWFLIILAIIASSVIGLKVLLEGVGLIRMIHQDRLAFFRTHYLGYTALAVLRTLYIGFFAIMFLTLFQFMYLASPAPVAVACVVFLIMLIGLGCLVAYACFHRIRYGDYVTGPDRLRIVKCKFLKIPFYALERESKFPPSEDKVYAGSLPWWRIYPVSEKSIHDDEHFTKKFGWLSSRFRRTRWWFFAIWFVYEFVRACFLAGAASQPMVQIFGLLVVEIIAFVGIIISSPFEGQRLNILVVYLLGFSKITTLSVSAALIARFNLARIPATVLAIVIIIIQGLLTIATLVAILVGAVTSYMSILRNSETIHPTQWVPIREKYFNNMDFKVRDIPRPPREPKSKPVRLPASEPLTETPFKHVRTQLVPKIEHEDHEYMLEAHGTRPLASQSSFPRQLQEAPVLPSSGSRAPSIRSQMSYTSLPRGAWVHRGSWSSMNFNGPRAGGNPTMNTPTSGAGPAGGITPPLSTQSAGQSNVILRDSSPINPFATPASSLATGSSSLSSMVRPKSWQSSKSSGGRRPQLRTIPSDNSIPPILQLP